MDGLLVVTGNNCNVYIYIEVIEDSQMKPKAWQEIEFLLLRATTESNMADILNLEKNPI